MAYGWKRKAQGASIASVASFAQETLHAMTRGTRLMPDGKARASAGWDSTPGPWPEGMDEAVATRGHFYFFNFAFTQ